MPSPSVLLLIADGMSWPVVTSAIDAGRLPTFKRLVERGAIRPCNSIFPSITPAATAALITGVGPRQHGVQGAFWYDAAKDDIEYFGDSWRVVLREGLDEYFDDYLRTLNDQLLDSPTLFEQAQHAGLSTAGLNLMWRRGETRHEVNQPLAMDLMPGVELASEIYGPDYLMLGDFVATKLPGADRRDYPSGLANRYGFNDQATSSYLSALVASDASPALTVAYFPENDFESHKVGAENALTVLEQLDKELAEIADHFGGLDRWLEHTAIVLVGDHGHSDISEGPDGRIDLEEVLGDWQLTPSGETWSEGDQILPCCNMRAAQLTLWDRSREVRESVVRRLLEEPRIDQVIYSANDFEGWRVVTRDRGSLNFQCADGQCDDAKTINGSVAIDERGRRWTWKGDLDTLDAKIVGQDSLEYGEYPDAMGRIAEGSPGRQNSLWLSARPEAEFGTSATKSNPKSSHGSLHRCDSQTVLIVAGATTRHLPEYEASIADVAPLCRAVLGIDNPDLQRHDRKLQPANL